MSDSQSRTLICPHCGQECMYGVTVCRGCQAEIRYGPTCFERIGCGCGTVLIGAIGLFIVGIALDRLLTSIGVRQPQATGSMVDLAWIAGIGIDILLFVVGFVLPSKIWKYPRFSRQYKT